MMCRWNPDSDALEPDRPHYDRSAACVIAQQYFPATVCSLRFHSRRDKFGARFKVFYFIFILFYFLEVRIWHCLTWKSVTLGVNVLEGLNEVSFISRYIYSVLSYSVQLNCDGTRWRTGGEVKWKLANEVGSQYPSHYLGTWCIQHYYCWCAHLGCQ